MKKSLPENEIHWPRRVLKFADAVKYIDAVGFCMLYPVKNIALPSLYYVVTRRNPHAEFIWDKYAAMVWRWKDELPGRRRAFYGKYFKGRGTFLSLAILPHFLAMRGTAVAPEDHDRFYREGRIREDARVLWETLAKHGPLATLELRHACKMETTRGNIRFKRAMLELQSQLLVVHFGTERETDAWASGRFELTTRAFPEEASQARRILPEETRATIAAKYLRWRPGAAPAQLARLFGWTKSEALAALK